MPTQFAFFFRGFRPRYIWKNGIVGKKREYVGEGPEDVEIWMQLFLDLLFVCMISKLSHSLVYCQPSALLFASAFSILYLFFASRSLCDEFCGRFMQDDIFHRLFYFIYAVGILVSVMNTEMFRDENSSTTDQLFSKECYFNSEYFFGFTYGYFITRSSISFLYLATMKLDTSGKVYTQFFHRLVFQVVECSLFIIADTAVENTDLQAGFIIIVALFNFFVTFAGVVLAKLKRDGIINTKYFTYDFPLNHLNIQSRLGQFILIMYGEAVVSILSAPNVISGNVYWTTIFGLLLVYMLVMHYYDQVQKYEGEIHAVQRDMIAGIIWGFLHPILGSFVLLISSGLLAAVLDSGDSKETNVLLAVGCGSSVLCMAAQRITHKGVHFRLSSIHRMCHMSTHLLVGGAHLSLLAWDITPRTAVIIHSLLATLSVVFDIVCNLSKGEAGVISHVDCHRKRAACSIKKSKALLKSFGMKLSSLSMGVSRQLTMRRPEIPSNDSSSFDRSNKTDDEANNGEEDALESGHQIEPTTDNPEAAGSSKKFEVQLEIDDDGEYYCLL